MSSKRFKLILIGLLLSVLIYVGAALLNNFTGNELLAVLIVAAVICAYPLLSLFRALFSHEAREVRLRQNPIKNTLRWALSNAPLEYKHLKERYFNADRHDAPTAPAPSSNIENDTDADRRVERAYNRFYEALNGLPPDSKVFGAFIENLAKEASASPQAAPPGASHQPLPADDSAKFEAAVSASIERYGVQEGMLRLAESHPEWRLRLFEWLRARQKPLTPQRGN